MDPSAQRSPDAGAEPVTDPPGESGVDDRETSTPTRWLTDDEYPAYIFLRGWPWKGRPRQ